jgi:hypothetical protein
MSAAKTNRTNSTQAAQHKAKELKTGPTCSTQTAPTPVPLQRDYQEQPTANDTTSQLAF